MKILKDETTYTMELSREELLSIAVVSGYLGGASKVRKTFGEMEKEIGRCLDIGTRNIWERAGKLLDVQVDGDLCIDDRSDKK